MPIIVQTPYKEILKDDSDIPLEFDNRAQAEEFLRATEWPEEFIGNCKFKEITNEPPDTAG